MVTFMAKKRKINFLRLIFIAMLCFFIVEIVKQEIRIHQLDKEIQATQSKIEELAQTHERLLEEERSASDPKYIEKVAREEYNMVKQNEIPVMVKE